MLLFQQDTGGGNIGGEMVRKYELGKVDFR
jgi:hypothetical protein